MQVSARLSKLIPVGRVTSEVEGGPGEVHSLDALRQFNSSLIALSKRVSPAVVQIMVTGYVIVVVCAIALFLPISICF